MREWQKKGIGGRERENEIGTRERDGEEGGGHFITFFMMHASVAEQRRAQSTATTEG